MALPYEFMSVSPQFTMPVVAQGPALRGDLSDPLWQMGARLADFVRDDGSNPAVTTEAYTLCDASHLYVAFVCHEPKIRDMTVSEAERDGPLWHEDCVELFLDPTRGKTWAYHWIVNTKGVIWDGLHAPAGLDRDYSADAQAGSTVLDDHWMCELKLPFRDIGGRPQPGDRWGVNFCRPRRVGELEMNVWALQDGSYAAPEVFGEAVFAPAEAPVQVNILSRGGACADVNDPGMNVFSLRVENTGGIPAEVRAEVAVAGQSPSAELAVIAAGRTETVTVGYILPADGQPYLDYRVQVNGEAAYHSRLQAVKPRPPKAAFRSWVVSDPLYEELLTDEPPGPWCHHGSMIWQHVLNVPLHRESAKRFAVRYVSDEVHRDHSLAGLRIVTGKGPANFIDQDAAERWKLTTAPVPFNDSFFPYQAPLGDLPWVLDPRAIESYLADAGKLFTDPAVSTMWAVFAGDEHDDFAVSGGPILMENPGDYAYIKEADEQVRRQFGGGRWGIPRGIKQRDVNPYKWIAYYRWVNLKLRERHRRLRELVQRRHPDLPIISQVSSGIDHELHPFEFSSQAELFDIFTHQVGYPGGADRWRASVGFLTKFIADLSGKEAWPCVHIENCNFPDAGPMEVVDELSQVFRNGGVGLHLFLLDIGGMNKRVGDTRSTYFGSPGRYHTIINICKLIRTMPRLKLPEYERTAIVYNDDTLAATPYESVLPHSDSIEACYIMLGPVARSWFKFIDCAQILKWPSLNERFDIIYLPGAKYQRPEIVTKFREFVAAGGTLVCSDPEAFATDLLGNDTVASRTDLFGVTVGARGAGKKLLPGNAELGHELNLLGEAYQLTPGLKVKVLATYDDGAPAITANPLGKGRAIFCGTPLFLRKAVLEAEWREFFTAWVKSLGVPIALDIWRFRIPDSVIWHEPAQPGVCVTNNRVIWEGEKPNYSQNVDVKATYTYTLAPDAMPDVSGTGDIAVADGRLTDRRKSIFAEKTGASIDAEFELPESNWMVSWARPEPVSIIFDLKEPRPLRQFKIWFCDTLPAVAVEGSIDGVQWRALGSAAGQEAGEDVVDMVISLDKEVPHRYLRTNFAARRPGQKLSIVEAEVWAEKV